MELLFGILQIIAGIMGSVMVYRALKPSPMDSEANQSRCQNAKDCPYRARPAPIARLFGALLFGSVAGMGLSSVIIKTVTLITRCRIG